MIGPVLVALWLAATAPALVARGAFLVAAAVCFGLTIGSLVHVAGPESALARNDGALARAMAVGMLFALAGLAQGLSVAALAPPRSRSVPSPGDRNAS